MDTKFNKNDIILYQAKKNKPDYEYAIVVMPDHENYLNSQVVSALDMLETPRSFKRILRGDFNVVTQEKVKSTFGLNFEDIDKFVEKGLIEANSDNYNGEFEYKGWFWQENPNGEMVLQRLKEIANKFYTPLLNSKFDKLDMQFKMDGLKAIYPNQNIDQYLEMYSD